MSKAGQTQKVPSKRQLQLLWNPQSITKQES